MIGRGASRLLYLAVALATPAACTSVSGAHRVGEAVQVGELTDSRHKKAFYLSLIGQLIEGGQAYAALAHLDEFDHVFGPSPLSQKLRGDAWLAVGNLAQAEQSYVGVKGPALSGERLNGLGRVAAARRGWPQAADYFSQAVAAAPANAEFLNNLGNSLINLRRYDEAEFALRKARQLTPTDARVVSNLLLILAKTGQTGRLQEIFSDVNDPAEMTRLRARLDAFVAARDSSIDIDEGQAVPVASQALR